MIIRVKKIFNFLTKIFPLKHAEDWDKVGHLFGDINQRVNSVVVALDLTPDVFQLAIDNKASLIITHHPFIFNDNIEDDFAQAPYKKEIVERLTNTNISVISLHTNYDANKKGTSFQVSQKLGIGNSKLSNLKYGVFFRHPISFNKLSKLLKKKLNLEIQNKNFVDNYEFNEWAILPGSGSPKDIIDLKNIGAELVVTSDIKWSTWQMAQIENINLIQVSHAIEDVFTKHISELITDNFSNIKVVPKFIINNLK